jgi:hypothetical protein
MTRNHCSACGKQNRPLKWCALWERWQCYPCIEHKVQLVTQDLDARLNRLLDGV